MPTNRSTSMEMTLKWTTEVTRYNFWCEPTFTLWTILLNLTIMYVYLCCGCLPVCPVLTCYSGVLPVCVQVTVENLIRVLTGRLPPSTPRSKRLLSDDRSNILVYMTGGATLHAHHQRWAISQVVSYYLSSPYGYFWEYPVKIVIKNVKIALSFSK